MFNNGNVMQPFFLQLQNFIFIDLIGNCLAKSLQNRECRMFSMFGLALPQLLFVTWINFPVIRPFIQFVEATKYNLYYRELSRTIGKSHITGREDKHVEENIFLQYEWLNREGTKRYFSFSKYSFNPSIGWSSSSTELYFWSLFGYMCQHTNTETNTKTSIAR